MDYSTAVRLLAKRYIDRHPKVSEDTAREAANLFLNDLLHVFVHDVVVVIQDRLDWLFEDWCQGISLPMDRRLEILTTRSITFFTAAFTIAMNDPVEAAPLPSDDSNVTRLFRR